jgi:glycosyltransferase involved in cell wall biosynthesis
VSTDRGLVVVANPGTHPELGHLAVAIAARGPVRYLTSASWALEAPLQRVLRLPGVRSTGTAAGLRRRALPAGLRPRDVIRLAGAAEVVFHLARSRGSASSVRLMDRRTARFQEATARRITRLRPAIVVAQYTGALEVFRAAGDALTVLNYPIAHHRWIDREFDAEAAANPEWADTLQGRGLPAETLARLDAEIEAAEAVLVPSRFVRRTFVESGVPESKVLVSNLGAEPVPARDRAARLDGGPLRLLYAGQVTQRKGLSYLVDAVAEVPEVELRIVGHRPPELGDRLEGRDRITVLPSLDRAALAEQYEWADLLTLPSLAEGFPLVAIEAMAHGTAVVLTDSAAAEDLIPGGEEGFRIPARDVDSLAAVLREAAADRGRVVEMGRAAARRAATFTWSAYGERTVGLLDALRAGR